MFTYWCTVGASSHINITVQVPVPIHRIHWAEINIVSHDLVRPSHLLSRRGRTFDTDTTHYLLFMVRQETCHTSRRRLKQRLAHAANMHRAEHTAGGQTHDGTIYTFLLHIVSAKWHSETYMFMQQPLSKYFLRQCDDKDCVTLYITVKVKQIIYNKLITFTTSK